MKVQVSGQHIDLGESLITYVEDRVTHVVKKYFDHAISADIHFVKQGYLNICDIIVNDGTGRSAFIKSDASCDEVYSSFDQALAKIEKQLRKYKNKIKDHHKSKTSEVYVDAISYVIDRYSEEETQEGGPITIAEAPSKIGTYSVAEAIMKMDLENHPALMFKNASTDRMNIVYYRKDGNIAWVDSRE